MLVAVEVSFVKKRGRLQIVLRGELYRSLHCDRRCKRAVSSTEVQLKGTSARSEDVRGSVFIEIGDDAVAGRQSRANDRRSVEGAIGATIGDVDAIGAGHREIHVAVKVVIRDKTGISLVFVEVLGVIEGVMNRIGEMHAWPAEENHKTIC